MGFLKEPIEDHDQPCSSTVRSPQQSSTFPRTRGRATKKLCWRKVSAEGTK